MPTLKDQLRADLTAAMKARDETRTRTLRMALTSISNEEVSGTAAHDLTDDDITRDPGQGGQASPRGRDRLRRRLPGRPGRR